jgi:hypothetical protein
MPQNLASVPTNSVSPLPLAYQLFFLWIEPVATAVGAYYAWFAQNEYMSLTYPTWFNGSLLGVSPRESIVLHQLANLYFVFALNEALVLRATNDLKAWRIFLLGLLIADFGHLFSVHAVGLDIYWKVWEWNSMYWGNLGFVYVGATMRTLFLLGVGLSGKGQAKLKT